jgi:ParB family transcriptional regulator, chromosome partitioning protein
MANSTRNSIARLGSLIEDHKKKATLIYVAANALIPYRKQSRTHINAAGLKELAASIKDIGIIEPILALPLGDGKYEIIAGERRWRAGQIAKLSLYPALVLTLDVETADKIHMAENLHRENLETMDLAKRVEQDVKEAHGNLSKVAAKYNKQKPWVSKLLSIAKGGLEMKSLVDEVVTADRAVLASVSSLERKNPAAARELVKQLKGAPVRADKRKVTVEFVKAKKTTENKGKREVAAKENRVVPEPSWRAAPVKPRLAMNAEILVVISSDSEFAQEFARFNKKYGEARLCLYMRHSQKKYALVEFGDSKKIRHAYPATELRVISVS